MSSERHLAASHGLGSSFIDVFGHGPTVLRRFTFIVMWLLPIMAFTSPVEMRVSSWEPLDFVKLFVLSFACFGGVCVTWANVRQPKFKEVLDPLVPFFLFFGLALISTFWSPLKSVTVFQSGSLVVLLMYSVSVGLLSARPEETSMILKHLCLVLLAFSGIVLAVFLWDPELSGLDRSRIHSGGNGIVHPTAGGGTASLGLLVPILCHVIGRFVWARKLLIPCILIHGAVLLLSNSRSATGLAVAAITVVLFWYSTNEKRALVIFGLAVLGIVVVLIDPGFRVLGATLGVGAEYVSRGQSADQISAMSGRSEMWRAIWAEYEGTAMMVGHGYYVTSARGSLLVWNDWQNHTAHNLVLQIAVSTGAIGLVVFLYALLQPLLRTILLWRGTPFQRRLLGVICVMCFWFLGWSTLSVSFMGPIRPESLVFFTLLGIGLGQAGQIQPPLPKLLAGSQS